MGQCSSSSSSSSSSNGCVAPEPPPAVPMAFTVKICNKRKKKKIRKALIKWYWYGEGSRFGMNADGLISMRGNFVPGTLDMCLHKYARYVEIQHLDHVQAANMWI